MKAEIAAIDSAPVETFIRLYTGKPLQLLSQHVVETCDNR